MSGLEDGSIFANRYRVVRCLARGGMGAVYEVVHLETERRRALKVMHAHILHSPDLRQRFQREAKVAAQVDSEFIVDVFDAGVDDATEMPFLVMELLRGEELSKRIKRLKRLPPGEVVRFLHQTALALDKTHQAGIVHRDLKPENLFLVEREEGQPRVKVLDFGIAKVIADGATSGSATMSIGTPLYMSPEQFNPQIRLTGASDVHALGMIAFTCLVGVPYWEEESRSGGIFAFGAVAGQGARDAASLRAQKRGVTLPPGFDEWFRRVTAFDPEARPSPATAATRDLAALLGVATSGEPLGAGALDRPSSIAVPAAPLSRPMLDFPVPSDERTLIYVPPTTPVSVGPLPPPSHPTGAAVAMPAAPISSQHPFADSAPFSQSAAFPQSASMSGPFSMSGPMPGAPNPLSPVSSPFTPSQPFAPASSSAPLSDPNQTSGTASISRVPPAEAARKNNTPAIVGAGVGVVAIAAILGVVLTRAGSDAPPAAGASSATAAPTIGATAVATTAATTTNAPAAKAADPLPTNEPVAPASAAPSASAAEGEGPAPKKVVDAKTASPLKPKAGPSKGGGLKKKYTQE